MSDSLHPTVEAARWVDEYGDYLFRFALARVRNRDAAEDLVQDTLVAAIRARTHFEGASALRTWLVGILKHKILDYFRAQSRTVLAGDLTAIGDEDRTVESFFDRAGRWRNPPGAWNASPDRVVEQKEFRRVLDSCLSKLPESMSRLFVLRDVEGVASETICETLGISPANLYTTLHRARFRLRRCLEENWFEKVAEVNR